MKLLVLKYNFLIISLFLATSIYCQNSILLHFAGTELTSGQSIPLDSVLVINQSQNCDTVLFGDAPTLLINLPNGITGHSLKQKLNVTIQPNPFIETAVINVICPEKEALQFTMLTIDGLPLAQMQKHCDKGAHRFTVKTAHRLTLLHILGSGSQAVLKLVNRTPGNTNTIKYVSKLQESYKAGQIENNFCFETGDQLLMMGYATGFITDSITDSPEYDTDYTFQLPPIGDLPVVITTQATAITFTTATCGGNVVYEGQTEVISRGVYWSTTPEPGISDYYTIDGSGPGQYTAVLTGLDTNTVYYVRAYATNSIGTVYGNEVVLATQSGIPCPDIPMVSYDGQTYHTVLIGNQCWMKENLNAGIMISDEQVPLDNGVIEKWCYDDDPVNCSVYGGLYRWDEIMDYDTVEGSGGICPDGWHIPTDEEIMILEGTVDSQYPVGDPIWEETGPRGFDAGLNLKSQIGWEEAGNGSDGYGFKALPAGWRYVPGSFDGLGLYLYLWSSTKSDSFNHRWVRSFWYNFDELLRPDHHKDQGYSVRCLNDQSFD